MRKINTDNFSKDNLCKFCESIPVDDIYIATSPGLKHIKIIGLCIDCQDRLQLEQDTMKDDADLDKKLIDLWSDNPSVNMPILVPISSDPMSAHEIQIKRLISDVLSAEIKGMTGKCDDPNCECNDPDEYNDEDDGYEDVTWY